MTPYRERREEGHYDGESTVDEPEVATDEPAEEPAQEPNEPAPAEVDDEPAPDADPVDELEILTRAELLELAKERGIITSTGVAMTKPELREALRA